MKNKKNPVTKKITVRSSPVDKLPGINKEMHIPDEQFPIVGIGASAGGLEAIESFFRNIPEDCGMAFVVIRHLDPTQEGMMPEMIQRFTGMKVLPATDRLKVEPDSVYVIPSNKSMSILNRTLYLFNPAETRGLRLPVDFFFISLADDLQEKSIGIVLSGMGSDGSMGLRAIKEKSGLVLVQDPATAKFDSMPRSAISSVLADFVAPADELPSLLIDYIRNKPVIKPVAELPVKDKNALEKIIIMLRMQTGNDFSQYKSATLYRRIERRMGVHRIDRISNYIVFLNDNPKEIEILYKELLIGVTHFFRDPHIWEHLTSEVLPVVFGKLPDRCTIRAWVPGCSTGEEAYSLAIVFKEAISKTKPVKNITIQIFATDLDNDAIEKARRGYYLDSISADVGPRRLNEYFVKADDGYFINPELREVVVFAPQNVIKDPPFTRLDFISCRNVLIYFDAKLQAKLLTMFQYCLNPRGILLLGLSETPGVQNSLFVSVNTKFRIFRRGLNAKIATQNNRQTSLYKVSTRRSDGIKEPDIPDNIETLADQLLLQCFAPPAVMTNEKGDIIYITGRTGDYLEPASGKASMNIFSMARKGLRKELSSMFRKAMTSNKKIISCGIKTGTNGSTQQVDITVQKIDKPEVLRGMYMVVFSKVTAGETRIKKSGGKPAADDSNAEILKEELAQTKDDLKRVIEEMHISKDGLNSINEELQVTNEELTTSQEEMQSLNEELQTVNIELQSKLDDYTRINNDLKNLINSTDIATLFTDKNLKIRRFTKKATEVFKLINTDVGRPFTDIVTELDYPGIADDAREVLRTLVFKEKNVSAMDERWFSVRIMPYRTIDDRIDGLVITFSDIGLTKKLEFALMKINEDMQNVNAEIEATNEALVKTEREYRLLFENMTTIFILHEMIYDDRGIPADYRYLAANPAFEKITRIPVSSIIGKTSREIFPDTGQSWIDIFAKVVKTGEPASYESRWSELNKDFDTWIFYTEKNHFAGIFSDITGRKHAEVKVQNSETRYRRLFESTKVGVLILDAVTGKIVDVNPFLIELIGFSYEELSGKELWEIGVFKNIAASKEAFLELQNKEYIRFEDMPLETKDGRSIDVEFISSIYLVEDKKVIQCNIRDITDRKIAELTVQNLLHEKEIILKEGHHRVKNNMNTISGLLSLQANDQENAEIKNTLLDSAGRVRSMMVLYDKLYRSEINSSLSIKEYLPSLIDEIVGIFPKNTLVKIETSMDDITLTAGTLSSLGIIINELITNSMKYAFSGRNDGIITVTAVQDGNRVSIIFEDNGCGLPESVTFENSTGFGMQLVGMLVGQINGTINIVREHGTRFIIEFNI